MNNYRIGFIGAGNMSQALIAGLLDSGSVTIQSLSAADPVPATLKALSERGMLTGVNLPIAVRERDFVFLGIKPQVADAVLPELADALVPGQVVVSMMAGVQTAESTTSEMAMRLPSFQLLVGSREPTSTCSLPRKRAMRTTS